MLSLAADMVHTFRARAAAWAVHGFTATGAVLALLALLAVDRHDWTAAMLWLFAALVVDGVDGTLARAAHVKTVAPRIDGDALDLVIDYLGYVFVPALFMLEARLLPPPLALPLCAASRRCGTSSRSISSRRASTRPSRRRSSVRWSS